MSVYNNLHELAQMGSYLYKIFTEVDGEVTPEKIYEQQPDFSNPPRKMYSLEEVKFFYSREFCGGFE